MGIEPGDKVLELRLRELEEEVSALRHAEKALREELERYRRSSESLNMLLLGMEDPILVADQSGGAVLFNRAYSRLIREMLGIEMRPGLRPHEVMPDRSFWDRLVRRVQKGEKFSAQYSRTFGDGELRHFEIRFYPLFEGRRFTGFTEHIRDVTARKRAEEAFNREKVLLEELSRSSRAAIVMGDSKSRVVRINESFTRLFGYTSEEALGKHVDDLITPPEFRADAEDKCKMVWSGEISEYDAVRRRKDGTLVDVSVMVSPIYIEGKRIGAYALYRDITEKMLSRKALEKEKALLGQLFESSQMAIVMGGEKGRILRINKAFTRMFGYTPKEALGRRVKDLIIPEEYHEEAERHRRRVCDGEITEYEAIRKRKDGSRLDVSIFMSPIYIRGEQTGAYILYQDITDRKRTERALQESEKKYRTLFNQIGDAVLIFDQDTMEILDCNQSAIDRYGYTREEWRTMKPYDLHPPEDLEEVKRNIQNTTFMPHWYTHLTKDGKRIPVEIYSNVITLDQRRICISIIRDVSERKAVEDQLRRSEEKFRRLAENSPFGLSIMNRRGEFEYFNRRFTEILGYTLADIPDKNTWFRKAYPDPAYRERVMAAWENDMAGVKAGIPGERSFTVRCKDGKEKVILFRNVEMADGKQYMTYEDVTERKRLEIQLRQAQKMEAIGTLAGGIAHDFNNILSGVIGYAELALEEVERGTTLEKDIRRVLEAGTRAKDLVNQILAFSRQREQELRPMQIGPVIKEALKLLRASIPSTIDIRQDIRGDPLVMADPTQIHQILMNLCTNACHAMEEGGGVLEVGLKQVYLDRNFTSRHPEIAPGSYMQLTVKDTGSGIPPEIMDRIFDPFFTTKGEAKGTGMGLSVVHGIVKAHGGTITAYSEHGRGSTFHVFLPVVDESGTIERGTDQPLQTGTERILFVDDEEFQVDLGKQMLERLGYKVTVRTSSVEALKLFRSNPYDFDLVITDMTMPGMTGDVLARELIAERPDIPVILCTGFSTQITEEKALEMGIRAFVMKPIIMSEISHTIRRVLEKDSGSGFSD
ncbi:MAG: PAS domain S-box protein [Deltaproteobacteria bacterium]|nr:PAS domain S-box protein [Deltaproteobacteria bacterium]